jgi:hypothetical protein
VRLDHLLSKELTEWWGLTRGRACFVWGGAWVLLSSDSAPGSAPAAPLGVVGVGVAGWNAIALIPRDVPSAVWWGVGLACCWVLRRHPWVGVFLVPLLVRVV